MATATLEDIVQATLDGIESQNYEEQQFIDGLKNREIYFNEQVDFSAVSRIVHNIFKWNREDDLANLEDDERQPITFHLTTEGGCVFSMWSIVNAIQSSKTKVIGKGYAMIASAGAYILIACHERHIQKDATVLLHAGGISLTGEANAAKLTMKHFEEYDKRVKALVLDRTNITPQMYTKRSKDEWYEHGDNSIKLGIADFLM